MPAFPDLEGRLVIEPDCQRCPALADCRERIAWGNGPVADGAPAPAAAAEMVVGEAPGDGDPDADRWRGGNRTGMAYTSRHSGRRIRVTLADAGFGPDRTFYANAVKCFPADPDDPTTNRAQTDAELDDCRDHLLAELDAVAPAVVVTTGKHATRSLLAATDRALDDVADGFLDAVLEPIDAPALGTTLVPLVHPTYREVWLPRLGDDREGYVAELRRTLGRLIE